MRKSRRLVALDIAPTSCISLGSAFKTASTLPPKHHYSTSLCIRRVNIVADAMAPNYSSTAGIPRGWALDALTMSNGMLCCPFHWHDSVTFAACAGKMFRRTALSRLSEHIREKHLKSYCYCATCGEGFGPPKYWDRHCGSLGGVACRRYLQTIGRNDVDNSLIAQMEDFHKICVDMVGGGRHCRSELMNDLDELHTRIMRRCGYVHGGYWKDRFYLMLN